MLKKIIKFVNLIFITLILSHCTKTQTTIDKNFTQEGKISPIIEIDRLKTEESKEQTESWEEINKEQVRNIKIALVAPLTGENQDLGKSIYHMVSLALGEVNNKNIEIYAFDENNHNGSVKILASSIKDLTPNFIIGPLMGTKAKSLHNEIKHLNIPILSLSNNSIMAQKNLYIMGINPFDQLEEIITYAAKNQKRKYIYALLPSNNFGSKTAKYLRELANKNNGKINLIEYYKEEDSESLIMAIESIKNNLAANSVNSVLFIPASDEKLVEVTELLKAYDFDIKNLLLIGNGQWDSEMTKKIELLNNAVFSSLPITEWQNLSEDFKHNFGYYPSRITAIVYDIIALINNIYAKDKMADFTKEVINNPEGFEGINGFFKLEPNGKVTRKYVPIKIENGNFIEIK